MAQKVRIETAYNVEIEYNLATVWDRLWAYIIDVVIKYGYIFLISFILSSSSQINYWIVMIAILPFIFYTLIFELVNNGQTPGKRAMEIQVVSLDGRNLKMGQVITRWFLRFLDFWIMSSSIAFLAVVSTSRAQRIGDIVADTGVITLKRRKEVTQSSYVKLPKGYKGSHLPVLDLKDHEVELIKTVVRDRSEGAHSIQVKAASHLESVLGIPKKESSKEYLRNIVFEYNYFVQKRDGILNEEEE